MFYISDPLTSSHSLSISIPSAPHGILYSFCVLYRSHQPLTGFTFLLKLFFLYPSHQPFTGSDSLFMFNIYPTSSWRVRILCLSSRNIPLAPGGSYSQVVLYIYPISPWRVRILCLCSISIPSPLHRFWFSVCAMYTSNHLLICSYSLFVFYVNLISPLRVLILCLCFISITSVLHGF